MDVRNAVKHRENYDSIVTYFKTLKTPGMDQMVLLIWGLNYGIVYTTGIDNSYQYYYDPETGEQLGDENTTSLAAGDNSAGNFTNMKSRKREETLNIYAGFI